MTSYRYIARGMGGGRKEGIRQAACSADVLSWLREQDFTPILVNELYAGDNKSGRTIRRKRVRPSDLAALCWQLTTMMEGGIPATTALETIAEDIENLELRRILLLVLEKMRKGETFSRSLSEFPKVFDKLSCAIILAGETSGNLAESLRKLAVHYDSRDKLTKKVKGAMTYPIFTFSFIILMVVFIMAFIIPRFRAMFDQIGCQLPALTLAFMRFYDMLRNNLIYIVPLILVLITSAGLAYTKTQKGHYLFSRIVLALPLLGKILSQTFITVFCRTMSTLVAAGVPVLEIFDILSAMTNNDIIKSAILQTRDHIVSGSNISSSLSASGFFPNMVIKMVQVGEESGSLSNILDRTANYYERKVDTSITTLISLLEPIMIVTVGTIVLVVVLALYLPIFSIANVK